MRIINSVKERLAMYKFMLSSQYQQGAELGKNMKKQHVEKLKEIKDGRKR